VRWVEFDVTLTKDSEAVLFHDETLDRTTDGHGPIANARLNDVKRLDAGSWFDADFSKERVPTLYEAIDALARFNLGVNVEIKPSAGRNQETAEVTASILAKSWPKTLPPPLISSFSPEALVTAKRYAPDIQRALLVKQIPLAWQSHLTELDCCALHCKHQNLTQGQVLDVKKSGFAVRCFTVNEKTRALKLLEWGVDGIFTDHPEHIPEPPRVQAQT
jgi:glycerophosphoryl diester phosphodiesterase